MNYTIEVTTWKQGTPIIVDQYPIESYDAGMDHLATIGKANLYSAASSVGIRHNGKIVAALCILGYPGKSGYQAWICEYGEITRMHAPLVSIP